MRRFTDTFKHFMVGIVVGVVFHFTVTALVGHFNRVEFSELLPQYCTRLNQLEK